MPKTSKLLKVEWNRLNFVSVDTCDCEEQNNGSTFRLHLGLY